MIYRIIAIALAAVAILSVPAMAQQPGVENVRALIQKVKKGVIRVESIDVRQEVASGGIGGGSGFVFLVDYDKREALALTNHHVSGHALVNAVKFWDEAIYKAELMATEPGIDVALIRIFNIPDERDLPDSEKTIVPCVLGDSDEVKIGELALAMGNPGASDSFVIDRGDPFEDFLLHQTANVRVITGRDTPLEFEVSINNQNQRTLGWQYGTNFDYAFRMSTSINGGNSGGPLFNARGEVIGINFYGGGFFVAQNSNHSIPINLAKEFAFQIMETGRFDKPWIGIDIIMPSHVKTPDSYVEFAERFRPEEITVYGVRRDSSASRAGFQQSDIIKTVDGMVFENPEDIRLYIFQQEIGAMVTFEVIRNGRELKEPIVAEVIPKRLYNAEFSV